MTIKNTIIMNDDNATLILGLNFLGLLLHKSLIYYLVHPKVQGPH